MILCRNRLDIVFRKMLLKLVVFALISKITLGQEEFPQNDGVSESYMVSSDDGNQINLKSEVPQDKSIVETYMVSSDADNHVNVKSERYIKVFDPKIGKYAYKTVINDNGKIHREAGFLNDNETSSENHRLEQSKLMKSVQNMVKNVFSRILELH